MVVKCIISYGIDCKACQIWQEWLREDERIQEVGLTIVVVDLEVQESLMLEWFKMLEDVVTIH